MRHKAHNNKRKFWCMGIFVHQFRLPRQGRGIGTFISFTVKAFTVKLHHEFQRLVSNHRPLFHFIIITA